MSAVQGSEHNHNEQLPEAITYLKSTADPMIKPDPRLFDVLNDAIDDSEPKNKHFEGTEYGIKTLQTRREAMNTTIRDMEETIDNTIKNCHTDVSNDIVTFARSTYRSSVVDDESSIEFLRRLGQNVIPTAMVMCGQNISDRFAYLETQLSNTVTPLIARLTDDVSTRQCESFGDKMYYMQKFIVERLFEKLHGWKVPNQIPKSSTEKRELRGCRKANRLAIDADQTSYFDMKKMLKLPPMTDNKDDVLRIFILWYLSNYPLLNEFWKKKHDNDNIKSCVHDSLSKIVIMIDCIEQWSPMMLSSLIHILHGMHENYKIQFKATSMPFILILGVSTTENLLSRMIEHDALRLLSVSLYYFKSSQELYPKLVEEILIDKSPILFDSCTLHRILNHFQMNDNSISRLKDHIRYLCMSHFMDTNASQYAAYVLHLNKYYSTSVIRSGGLEGHQQVRDDKVFERCWIDEETEYIDELMGNVKGYEEGVPSEMFCLYLEEQVFHAYKKYKKLLATLKEISDVLKLNWSRTDIIAKLQNKKLLTKQLLTQIDAKDPKIDMDSNACDRICQILLEYIIDSEPSADVAKESQIIPNDDNSSLREESRVKLLLTTMIELSNVIIRNEILSTTILFDHK